MMSAELNPESNLLIPRKHHDLQKRGFRTPFELSPTNWPSYRRFPCSAGRQLIGIM